MYNWSKPFRRSIEELRRKEESSNINTLGSNLSIISSYLSLLLICICYISFGGVLPDKVYASMSILTFFSLSGLMYFHIGRMFIVNFAVILKRIQEILSILDVLTIEEITQQQEDSLSFPV